MNAWFEKQFKLSEHGTNVRTEILAGITTFMTMAYIIFVNPGILSATGMPFGALLVATCLGASLATFLMAFLANYPFALAGGARGNIHRGYHLYPAHMHQGARRGGKFDSEDA